MTPKALSREIENYGKEEQSKLYRYRNLARVYRHYK